MKKIVFALAAVGLVAGLTSGFGAPAMAQGVREARIPFVQYGGIRDWRADRNDVLFVQDGHRRWYQVDLMGPCNGLEYANGVRFLPSDGAGTFDRFSWISADGERCKVESVQAVRGVPRVRNHPGYRG